MTAELIGRIKSLAVEHHAEIIGIRRHLHKHPELSFKEFKTAEYVAANLSRLDIPHETGIGGNGIVALIQGNNADSKTVALRADMDALPIEELNECSYKSTNKGVMHACGHDVHTSSLLGTASILSALKAEFEGTVKLIFQPAEERFPGGASAMIAEGVLQDPNVDAIIGQHVNPRLETGKVGFRSGMYMAAADELYMTVRGKGGHAAYPQLVVDPVLITAQILSSLQQIVSRKSPPAQPMVLSFGRLKAEGATNVIPDQVYLEGTFRSMDQDVRFTAHEQIRKMACGIAESMGGHCDLEIRVGYPPLVNNEKLTWSLKEWAGLYMGKENVVELDLNMGGEDFAYFSQNADACFYRLGTANEAKNINSMLHTPTFDVDEESLRHSMGLMAYLTMRRLGQ